MKPTCYTSWVLVCDRSHARVFAVEKKGAPWTILHEIEHPQGRLKAHEFLTDRAGRVQERSGLGRRSAMELETDPTETDAQRFAQELADLLDKGLEKGSYSRLLVAAPPHFLGLLRTRLSERVAKRLTFSLDHDYTWVDAHSLEDKLGTLL